MARPYPSRLDSVGSATDPSRGSSTPTRLANPKSLGRWKTSVELTVQRPCVSGFRCWLALRNVMSHHALGGNASERGSDQVSGRAAAS